MADKQQGSTSSEPIVDGLLGDLERDIMEVIWSRGEANVHDVQAALVKRNPAYTTVMTVMGRLYDKGVLARQKQGRAFIYRAAHDGRRGFVRQQARQRIHSLMTQFGDLALAEFVDELSGTPEQVEALETLLNEQRENSSQ